MAAGNCSVLVILDSRRAAERARADLAVFAALDHFGVLYEAWECGEYMPAAPGHLAPRAAYVLAHDGAGAGLSADAARVIAEAVLAGAGLLSLDREVDAWPPALQRLLPRVVARTRGAAFVFAPGAHWIARGHEPEEMVELDRDIAFTVFADDERFRPLCQTLGREALILAGAVGEGRVAAFGTGAELYEEGVFGHVRGLDGLLWRGLVWAAAKPFPMRCIPPFLTARIDDCNGAYSSFRWVDALNRHGVKPNLGLFIDEMGPTDWAAARRLFEKGLADFSMHAFRDDFYKARPNYRPYAAAPDKPDLSDGGRRTAFEGLSLDHQTGRSFDADTVRRNFARMDAAFARAGLRHSRIINAHFGEVGWRAIPEFLRRGADLPCNNSAVGQLYSHQPPWRPKPYAARGRTGRYGLVIDRCPQHPELTFVSISASHVGSTHMELDMLAGHVPFLDESPEPKIEEAAARGAANVKRGLDALAWGLLMTHEERINVISLDDWAQCVDRVAAAVKGWDIVPAGREEVSVVVKRLFDSALVRADFRDGALLCEICGRTDGPSPLTIWDNDGDACARRVVDAPALDGVAEVRVE